VENGIFLVLFASGAGEKQKQQRRYYQRSGGRAPFALLIAKRVRFWR